MNPSTGGHSQPLAGVRVLDFSHYVAGPFCTRLFADLGAEVVKVESSTRPETVGGTHFRPDYHGRRDRSPNVLNVNRNKRSISVNLKTASGVDVARRLAAAADVLVENFSVGVMDRLGLGYEQLQRACPHLIYVSLSGYGHQGPRRDWTSMNMTLQAYSGLMMVTGAEGDPPITISNSWNDYVGGLHGCAATLQALSDRAVSGCGASLDISQFECSVATLGALSVAGAVNREAPPRLGNRSAHAAPQGCYRCAGADDWCTISVLDDSQWQALLSVMGQPEQLRDRRLDTLVGRLCSHDEIDAAIEAWTRELTSLEVEGRLKTAGVPAERMRRVQDVLDSGQVFRWLEDPPGWMTPVTALPFTFSRSAVADLVPAPHLGEQTDVVLREWLSLNDRDIEQLRAEEALV